MKLFLLLSTILTAQIGACPISANFNNDIENSSCSINSFASKDIDKREKRAFERRYNDEFVQESIINSTANIYSEADTNNNAFLKELVVGEVQDLYNQNPNDPRLKKIIQEAFPGKKPEKWIRKNLSENSGANFSNNKTAIKIIKLMQENKNSEAYKLLSGILDSPEHLDKALVSYSDKPSPQKWMKSLEKSGESKSKDSESYDKHYRAYFKERERIKKEYEKDIEAETNKQKKEDIRSAMKRTLNKLKFLEPTEVVLDLESYRDSLSDERSRYFNCRESYSLGDKFKTYIEEPGNEDNGEALPDDKDNLLDISHLPAGEPQVKETTTCDVGTNFEDDQFKIDESMDMYQKIKSCVKDIPANAKNVKIIVESCASTLRTHDRQFVPKSGGKPSNLVLSEKRSKSIVDVVRLISPEYGDSVEPDFQGTNKMRVGGELVGTGTCGPWVQADEHSYHGDHHMNAQLSCSMVSDKEKCDDPSLKQDLVRDGLAWLCDTHSVPFGTDLNKHRYNKIHISYDLPEEVCRPESNEIASGYTETDDVLPLQLKNENALKKRESNLVMICLEPVLTVEKRRSGTANKSSGKYRQRGKGKKKFKIAFRRFGKAIKRFFSKLKGTKKYKTKSCPVF